MDNDMNRMHREAARRNAEMQNRASRPPSIPQISPAPHQSQGIRPQANLGESDHKSHAKADGENGGKIQNDTPPPNISPKNSSVPAELIQDRESYLILLLLALLMDEDADRSLLLALMYLAL